MRRVRFLKRNDFLRRQMQGKRRCGILKMKRLGCANNGRGDGRLVEQPGERNLRGWNATLSRNLTQAVHNSTISFFGLRVHLLAELVALGSLGGFALPGARQPAAGQGARPTKSECHRPTDHGV